MHLLPSWLWFGGRHVTGDEAEAGVVVVMACGGGARGYGHTWNGTQPNGTCNTCAGSQERGSGTDTKPTKKQDEGKHNEDSHDT